MIKIITDTSSDILKEEKEKYNIDMIPFVMNVMEDSFVDDENLDKELLLEKLENSPKRAKNGECVLSTSCPSPATFLDAFEANKDKDIILLTISNILSGSYNSANIAKEMFLQSNPNNKIHIVNTLSDAAGPALVTYKLIEYVESGLSFEECVERIEEYVKTLETFVILERLDNVIKTGRLSRKKGMIATTLNIKPLMVGVNGELVVYKSQRGIKKAIDCLLDRIGEISETKGKKILISHTKAENNVKMLVDGLKERYEFDDIIIRPSRGISMCYCDIGGMVISLEK